MQTILPYSRDSTSAAMPVVFSCHSCSLLQVPAIPAAREKNPQPTYQKLEMRKSLPNLLPSWIPLSYCLRRVTTTRWTRRQGGHSPGHRTSAAAAIAGKWAEAGSRAMRLFITQTALCSPACARSSLIHAAAGAKVKAWRRKRRAR